MSPSGPVRPEHVTPGIDLLRSWGLTVTLGAHAYDREGYLAGSDADRLADLHAALRDPAVRAVLCTRGGYGVQRIVDGLDPSSVRDDPTIVLGFSDITALHLALWRTARLATLHGPAFALRIAPDPATVASLRAALFEPAPVVVRASDDEPTRAVTTSGRVAGRLTGGNLAMLTASLGTPDAPDTDGAVLLVEDIAEQPYKVDRMLTHLHRAGALAKVAGVAVGQFTDCDGTDPTVLDVLAERLHDLGVPVLGGLPVGHGDVRHTVPLGTRAVLDADAGTLTVDPGVRPAG
ncbi:LD-carboxypeptidase [Actinocatenispora rupis]|uniref:Peptidase S66 n=1 Tax=Actinocatenispora rupis TaxID=519421 RepID=A0A8J3NFN8_9ACTN|nr:peptidase S66 [Actinocatenispora rupis]